MGNSRIHYVQGGELAACGRPWKNKRRTRVAERATCEDCREKVAQQRAAGKPRDVEAACSEAELGAIMLVEFLDVASEASSRQGRWAEAASLSRLRERAGALRQDLLQVLTVEGAPRVRVASEGFCRACPHPPHEPGACGAVSGSLLSLAPRPCPCAAGVGATGARKVREVAA